MAIDVSAETSRRLSCDASLVEMRHGADGAVLDVGRKTRTVPTSIRRALEARDRSCRFPGCTARRCDAHHVEPWIDGGGTSLDNLVLLCRRHHRAVREGRFDLIRHHDGRVTFLRPNGTVLDAAPALPLTSGRFDGVSTAHDIPVWDGTPFDVVYAMDVLYSRPGPSLGRQGRRRGLSAPRSRRARGHGFTARSMRDGDSKSSLCDARGGASGRRAILAAELSDIDVHGWLAIRPLL